MRNFHFPGRSPSHARHGMAATEHPLASLTAIDMLRRGGSAADAVVAAAAVLAVVEPMATGVGGDAFCLVANGDGVEGYNGSGRAPAGLSLKLFEGTGLKRIPVESPHVVTVPGAVDCWLSLLERHGKLDRATVLAPAIAYAMEGFAVTQRVAHEWTIGRPKLAKNANAAALFLPQDRPPRAGEMFRNPGLGQVLQNVARDGRAGFYEGWAAEDMVESLRALGGTHTREDFAAHRGDWVTPIRSDYRGVELFEIPPNGQGVTALLMLNILENFTLREFPALSAARFHLEAEATRLAYQERDRIIADPARAKVDVAQFTDKAFAQKLAAGIDMTRAGAPAASTRTGDTTYLAVADASGLMVSFINSIYHGFGSGIASAKSGVLFHNRGHGFVLDPTHPNAPAGGKRPFHTIIPAMARKEGRPWLAFGVMGGDYQAVGHAHVLTNLVDYGMDIQEAIDCPRGFLFNGEFALEQGISESVKAELAGLGHKIVAPPEPIGGGQGVMRDVAGQSWIGGSDPRKDGCALGY
ncbi:MAG: gamma-glutamyltransferase [Rhodospirillaceae bacterium]